MNNIELAELMQKHNLTTADLQVILVCTERQVYRYLSGETPLLGARLALLMRQLETIKK